MGCTSSIPDVLTRTKSSDCPERTTRQNSVSTCGADELLGNSSTSIPLLHTRRTPPNESARKVVTTTGSASSREISAIRTSHQFAPSTSQSKLSRSASGSAGVNRSPDPARIEVASAMRQAQAACRVYAPTLWPSISRGSPNWSESRSAWRVRPHSRRPASGARTRSTMSFSGPPCVQGEIANRRPVQRWNQPPSRARL